MPVTPIEPIIIPVKTLDKFWIKDVRISSPVINGEAVGYVAMMPYSDSGDFSESIVEFEIKDIMLKASQNPDSNIAKAMYFLIAALDDEYKLQVGG